MGQSGLAGTTGRDLSGKRNPGYPVTSDDFLVSFDFDCIKPGNRSNLSGCGIYSKNSDDTYHSAVIRNF